MHRDDAAVSYPAADRPAIREKLIDTARRLFNRHGFAGESVNTSAISTIRAFDGDVGRAPGSHCTIYQLTVGV